MEGWLNKKSGGLSFGFSKKYVRLENYLLCFYSSPTDRSSKDPLDLRTCSSVGDGVELKDPQTQFDMQIVAAKKKMILRASSSEDKQCWLRCLACFNGVASQPNQPIPIPGVLLTGLHACIQALSRDGCVQGIFRESGKLEEVKAIFLGFMRGAQTVPAGADVHAVAGALKKFLREMPETLLTNRLFEQVCQPNPTPSRLAAIVQALPRENREILTSLTELLYLIVCDSGTTRMDVKNLAIVLTPNITRKDQQGSVVPIEPFWKILISNKDSVLYPGGVNPSTPVPATPASRSLMTSPTHSSVSSRQQQSANSKPPPSLAIASSQQTLGAQNAVSAMSPMSEPAQSPAYQHHHQYPTPSDGSLGGDSLLEHGTEREDIDSLLEATDGDISLLEDAPRQALAVAAPMARQTSSIRQTNTDMAAAAAAAVSASAMPKPAVAAQKPTALPPQLSTLANAARGPSTSTTPRTATTTPRVPAGSAPAAASPSKAGYNFDDAVDDDDDGTEPGNPRAAPPTRSAAALVGGARAVQLQRKTVEDDDMDLFGESADGVDAGAMDSAMQSQAKKNADAIRQARDNRSRRAMQAPISPMAPAPAVTSAFAASGSGVKSPNTAMKDSFVFDDSLDAADDGTLGLSPVQKKATGGKGAVSSAAAAGAADADASLDIAATEDASAVFDTPPMKPRPAPTAAAVIAAAASSSRPSLAIPKPAPSIASGVGGNPQDSLLNSSFDDEDFTLGSEMPTEAAGGSGRKQHAGAAATGGVRNPPSPSAPVPGKRSLGSSSAVAAAAEELGLSHISPANDTLNDGEDASLLSLASDLSLAEKRRPTERKVAASTTASAAAGKSLAAPATSPQQHHPDASLTFGDDTDFDLSAVDEASVKENVFSSRPAAKAPAAAAAAVKSSVPVAAASSSTVVKSSSIRSATPPRSSRLAPPPLSAVKETVGASAEDELCLSMDDSFSSDAPPLSKLNTRSALIAAAAAKARAAKAGIAQAAPTPAAAAAAVAPPRVNLFDDEDPHQFSVDIDSQLNSPPRKPPTTTVATPVIKGPIAKFPPAAAAGTASAKSAVAPMNAASKPFVSADDHADENSLDLLTRGGDASLDLLSAMDESERPPMKKATAAGKAAVAPATKSISAAPAAAKQATASSSSSSSSSSSADGVKATAEAALALIKSATATHRSDSEEIARLLAELRRLEVENMSMKSRQQTSEDALQRAMDRAEDAEARLSSLVAAAAGQDELSARAETERALKDQSTKLQARYAAQITLLNHRAEEAERVSLGHLAAKDLAEQSAVDARDAHQSALMKVEAIESAMRSTMDRIGYFEREGEKKDASLSERRAAVMKLQAKQDALLQAHSIALTDVTQALAAKSAELTQAKEKLRMVTSEREEMHLASALSQRKLTDVQAELDQLKTARLESGGSSEQTANVIRSMKQDRERESALHASDRAAWERERAAGAQRLREEEERTREALRKYAEVEAEKNAQEGRVEQAEMSTAQAKQKSVYLTKALDALEADQQRRLRSVLASLASRALLCESLEGRLSTAEGLLERHTPSDVFSGYLASVEHASDHLTRGQEELQGGLSRGSTEMLGQILERFPALKGVGGLVNAPTLFARADANGTNATMSSTYQSLASSPASTARYQSLHPHSGGSGSASGGSAAHGTYRSALEFLPMTAAQGSLTARLNSADQEEKTSGGDHGDPSSLTYRPITHAPFGMPTYTSLHSARFDGESFASTARSTLSSGGGVVSGMHLQPVVHSRLVIRLNFDESKRQLMQIELKTRAGLDASVQRLAMIEDTLQRTQADAQKQLANAALIASPRRR